MTAAETELLLASRDGKYTDEKFEVLIYENFKQCSLSNSHLNISWTIHLHFLNFKILFC